MDMLEEQPFISDWFWVVAWVCLVWYCVGAVNYVEDLMYTAEQMPLLASKHRALLQDRPTWIAVAAGIGVFGGVFGSLALILKKAIAQGILVTAFLGVLVHMSWVVFVVDMIGRFGRDQVMMPLILLSVAGMLAVVSTYARFREWIT